MEFNPDDFNYALNIFNSSLSGFRHIAYQNHSALCELENNLCLSVADRKFVHSAKLSALQINRLCNIVSYLINPDSRPSIKQESFDVENLINSIASEFERIASAYAPLSVTYTSRLKGTDVITLSRTHFELEDYEIRFEGVRQL